MNTEDIIKAGVILLLITSIVMSGACLVKMEQGCESCEMRFNNTEFDGLRGVWSVSEDDEYMCVSLRGRTVSEINDTICHECDHHHVYNDPEHFCEGYI